MGTLTAPAITEHQGQEVITGAPLCRRHAIAVEQGVIAITTDQLVKITGPAVKHIHARAAVQGVIAGKALHQISAIPTTEQIIATLPFE